MTDQVIGVARIDIDANASGVEAATDKAKKSIASMSQDAQAQYQRLSSAEKRRIDSLIRQADTVGMTRAQQVAYSASLKTSGPLLDDLTRRLKTNETAVKKAGIEFNKYGLSAKQEVAALRQVPAQITDIVTSLQGGQRPLTVLLQQGGQLKDVFGGVVPAVKALGGALIGMINPATLALGALTALAFGYLRGAKEGEEFRKTLILTNGAIGVSADELQNMAARIDAIAGTQANAAKVLNLFAKEATVSAANLQQYAQTAIEWERVTGQAAEEIVKQFTELAEDPLKASEKLNESMRYLTAGTYEQIRALIEAGDHTNAASLAQSEYDRVLRERTPQMVENLGYVERAWKAIKNASAEAMDALLGVGRPTTLTEQLAQEQRDYAKNYGDDDDRNAYRGVFNSSARAEAKERIASLQERIRLEAAGARYRQESQREEQRKTEATIRWAKQKDQVEDKAAKREKEISQARRDALILGKSELEVAQQIAAINEKYKDKQGKSFTNDAATRMLMSLREQEAALRAQVVGTEKLTGAQRDLAKFEQQIADIKSKQTLTADEKSILLAQDKLRAQHEINVAVEQEAQQKSRQIELERQLTALRANQSLNEAQFLREMEEFGRGDAFRGLNRELSRVEDQYRRIIAAQSAAVGGLSPDAMALIQQAMEEDLALVREQYDQRLDAQSKWENGAVRSLENYYDHSRDIAGQIEGAFDTAFTGMEDAIVRATQTGKLSVSDMVSSIIADMARMAVRQSVTGPLAGAIGNLLGGLIGGGGSAPVTYGAGYEPAQAFPLANAKGNVFDSSSLSRYSNGVYNSPKLFQFAKGAGVFAEAGPEAIMPLKRGPDGTLGVRAQSSAPNVEVNVYGAQSEPQVKTRQNQDGSLSVDLIFKQMEDRLASGVLSGQGKLGGSIQKRFGLVPQLG